MSDHESLFPADDFVDPKAIKRGTSRVATPSEPKAFDAKGKEPMPTVRIEGQWHVCAYVGKKSPLAHYVIAPPGRDIIVKGRKVGVSEVAALLCGAGLRTLEVDADEYDACRECVRKHADGHHLSREGRS